MIPTDTFDPRDPWAKTRRMELVRYAAELGIKDIVEQMPKDLMIKRLKAHGVQPPRVPPRPIGKNFEARSGTDLNSHHFNGSEQASKTTEVLEIDADELTERQWAAQQKPDIVKMGFNDMRAELKAGGVKLDRKWRLDDVRAQLEKLRSGKQDTP